MTPFLNERAGYEEQFTSRRLRMVEEQLRNRGIRDERVLAAMARVPREKFVAAEYQSQAYADAPLPIGLGQTISQPFMVATMLEVLAVAPNHRVLEVGTGTGYEAAVLGELAAEVWSIEAVRELAEKAGAILELLGYQNVEVLRGDGTLGLSEHAPYDRILVAAGAPRVPPSLIAQLAVGGKLAVPVGTRTGQQLQIVRKADEGLIISTGVLCSFVPLLGAEGWQK
jgi:protein-L-isoaspartate(D-aspartate) O-methyltransferase